MIRGLHHKKQWELVGRLTDLPMVIETRAGYSVAEIAMHGSGSAQRDNARLFLASPHMYEATKEISKLASRGYYATANPGLGLPNRQEMSRLFAKIFELSKTHQIAEGGHVNDGAT